MLTPIITKVFNCSLREQSVPLLWKLANVILILKESPLMESNQLRPISLTNIIMRLFERLVYKDELLSVFKSVIKSDQFAYKEDHNSTMALLKCHHNWLSWLDKDIDFVWVFAFDFSKAFDMVAHNILCDNLKQLDLNPYIINWIISFLGERKQRVVVDGITTEFVCVILSYVIISFICEPNNV